jgi:hypothetical protein
MFTHQTVEKSHGRIDIPDADSKVLGQMLDWMYTGKASGLADLAVARGLLFVADKYQMDELKVLCIFI